MSFTYRAVLGDDFELIARKVYGSEREADRIRRANPGVSEPLTPDTQIIIPAIPDAPVDVSPPAPSVGPNEVAILINDVRFRFWRSVRITRGLDAIDTISLDAPFESDAPGFRRMMRPFAYQPLKVTVGGQLLFSGTVIGVAPSLQSNSKTVTITGYSRPGVLADCTASANTYPLEFNEQTLDIIAATLCSPFGVAVTFRDDPGAPFERVALEPGDKIWEFLADLARQRNLVITSTEFGSALFWSPADDTQPVARLAQGRSPVTDVVPAFSPQSYYSHITGIQPTSTGLDGEQFTVRNPLLANVVRPFTFSAPDTVGAELKEAVESKAARMFGNMLSYVVGVSTWRDPAGRLWAPNTLVTLTAPDAMVYTSYTFLIRDVELYREDDSETAALTLTLPGSFGGTLPERLPWD